MVAGGVCPVRWPNLTSAMVRVPSARWQDCEESTHRMLTAGARCSAAISLGIQRPRSLVAACSACLLGWLECVVQVPPPPGRGGPRWWADRFASGVGGLFHACALSWGATLIRGLVRRATRRRLPLILSGYLPQGIVIALEVCLS